MTTINAKYGDEIGVKKLNPDTVVLRFSTWVGPRGVIDLGFVAARELRDELSRILGDPPALRVVPRDEPGGPGHPKFRELLEEIWRDKHIAKASGYGDRESGDLLANLRASESVGIPAWLGAWVRSLDKDHRTNQAFKGGEPGPSLWPKVRSDLLEKAAYCLLVIILFEESREGGQAPGAIANQKPEGPRDPEAAA